MKVVTFLRVFLIAVVICFDTQAIAQLNDKKNIAVTIIDAETKLPIKDFKVEAIKANIGNTSFYYNEAFLVGYTDECGYVEAYTPLDMAWLSWHGVSTDVFTLLLTHCTYGQTIKWFTLTDLHKSFEIKKPFVYDLKAIVNDDKTAITLQWRIRKSTVRRYFLNEDNYTAFSPGTAIVEKYPSSLGLGVIYNEEYVDSGLNTFTDTDLGSTNVYRYLVRGNVFINTYVPGCRMLNDTITVNLDDGPGTYVALPKAPAPCTKLMARESLDLGEIDVSGDSTGILNLYNIGQTDTQVSLTLPDGFSSPLSSTSLLRGDTLDVPITFQPTAAKDYSGPANFAYDSKNLTVALQGSGIAITGTGRDTDSKLQVFPTAYQDILRLQVDKSSTGILEIKIFSLQGVEIYSADLSLKESTGKYDLNLGHLAAGAQVLQLENNGKLTIVRIVKL